VRGREGNSDVKQELAFTGALIDDFMFMALDCAYDHETAQFVFIWIVLAHADASPFTRNPTMTSFFANLY